MQPQSLVGYRETAIGADLGSVTSVYVCCCVVVTFFRYVCDIQLAVIPTWNPQQVSRYPKRSGVAAPRVALQAELGVAESLDAGHPQAPSAPLEPSLTH